MLVGEDITDEGHENEQGLWKNTARYESWYSDMRAASLKLKRFRVFNRMATAVLEIRWWKGLWGSG